MSFWWFLICLIICIFFSFLNLSYDFVPFSICFHSIHSISSCNLVPIAITINHDNILRRRCRSPRTKLNKKEKWNKLNPDVKLVFCVSAFFCKLWLLSSVHFFKDLSMIYQTGMSIHDNLWWHRGTCSCSRSGWTFVT